MANIQVKARNAWAVTHTQEGNWVAVCDAISLTMEGSTLDELYANIREVLHLMFTDLLESGELDEFLRAHGWEKREIPGVESGEPIQFDVPIELLFDSNNDSPSSPA